MSVGKVLVVGDVITDIIVIPEGAVVHGSDCRSTIRVMPGGSAANQSVWLASLGVAVSLVARVAVGDHAGKSAYFKERRVEPLLLADEAAHSGLLICIVDRDGERSFLTDRGSNLNLCAEDLPFALLDGVTLLSVSGYCFFTPGPREAVIRLIGEARRRGIATAVDPASVGFLREVGSDNFLDWTHGVATIFANLDEALELTGSVDLSQQMQSLGLIYSRVVIKRGAAGAAIGGYEGVAFSMPAPIGEVVDTTGAGDAFAAAFLASDLAGQAVESCLRAGIETSARAIRSVGGQAGALGLLP